MLLEVVAEAVKRFLLPGSLPLLLLGLSVGLLWWYADERRSRHVRAGLTLLALGYWLLATPFVSSGLERGLAAGYQPLHQPIDVDAVVVLGGGAATHRASAGEIAALSRASSLRALEGVRLFRLLGPEWVVVSGGTGRDSTLPESVPLRRALVDQGIPQQRILLESGSNDTHDQALLMRSLFEVHKIDSFVLVTSPSHMRRADLAFRAAGLEGIPSPAPARSLDDRAAAAPSWLPSFDALGRSTVAARELMALIYYWLRGWI